MRRAWIILPGAAAILVMTARASTGQPTVTDIALCNEQAARASAPSALPRPAPAPEAVRPAPAVPNTARGERTDPSGTVVTEAPDPLLHGMDASKLRDTGYRAAYRQCMERRVRPR